MLKQSPTTEGDKSRAEYFSIFISELRYCNPALKFGNKNINLDIIRSLHMFKLVSLFCQLPT
jgi:hypothetical protein